MSHCEAHGPFYTHCDILLKTFNFTGLPTEIRFLVYKLVFANAYGGVNSILEHFIDRILLAPMHSIVAQPTPNRVTPSVLLVCRQLYQEASSVLRRQAFYLQHGLLDFELRHLIRWTTLRNLRRIVITDVGHDILDPKLRISFAGHRRVFIALAGFLSNPGHRLEYLEINFTHKGLKKHFDDCYYTTGQCDMRRWVNTVYSCLARIHGVREVKITGYIHDHMKTRLIESMQADHSPFYRLPLDIRKRIFSFASRSLDTISAAMNEANTNVGFHLPRLSTPNLLLIDRRTTGLYLATLRATPLIIDLDNYPRHGTCDLNQFITDATLRAITNIHLILRHRQWLFILSQLSQTLYRGHSLHTLTLTFHDNRSLPCGRSSTGFPLFYPDPTLHALLLPLGMIRGVGEVVFQGDLAYARTGPVLGRIYADMTGRPAPGPARVGGRQ
ncbi:hypothetical protein BDZ85DRAFT_317080 [Elsinoe ampelina]|uniref:F-box domain-containing protein n=1 Tax=Elsinoe ampelina TaxID=302913 RepID=A0A6A6GKT4_9PEZI|nr:hypothetical protein BDZ85DRAFT_317080 [Elsinoe ampelina]